MHSDLRFAFRQLLKSPGFAFTAIATAACLLPAIRATKVDPIIALRAE